MMKRAMLIPLLLALMSPAAWAAPCEDFLGMSNTSTYPACAAVVNSSIEVLGTGTPAYSSLDIRLNPAQNSPLPVYPAWGWHKGPGF